MFYKIYDMYKLFINLYKTRASHNVLLQSIVWPQQFNIFENVQNNSIIQHNTPCAIFKGVVFLSPRHSHNLLI